MKRILIIASLFFCTTLSVNAQLSKNPDKFLGNITTRYQVDAGGGVPTYASLWNQITPENESKWASVEGTRGSYSWWGADNAYNYAKNHNFPFKFHTLVWGSQYPSWFTSSLSVKERYNAIVKWMDEVKKHYPDLAMIDVVNEAVGMHQQGNPLMKESLGGGGVTGYDWLIKAFELAYERWPNAILIYNDFNTFQWDTDAYIDLVRTLRDAGAPIDAYGCQSHDVNDISKSNLQTAMTKIQNAVKMPMYITELDIDVEDDNQQKAQYESIFPLMWEADYCAGVTLWGYIHGATWVDNSGLYKNGSERPAMTWLKTYMATDAAKNAKSPFPGMKKQISLYIKPSVINATRGDTLDITVRAQMVDKNKSIDSIKLYVKGELYTKMTKTPYVAKYVPSSTGKHALKAIVYTSNGKTYQREGSFMAYNPRSAFKSITLPGTLQFEDFDAGGEGLTFHDSDSNDEGNHGYRSDNGGIDIKARNGGQVLGNTDSGEWMEYTVNVSTAGTYKYRLTASSGVSNSSFSISINKNGSLKEICQIDVPQTGDNSWSTYSASEGQIGHLDAGKQIIRVTMVGGYANLDKIEFILASTNVNYITQDDMNNNGIRYNLGGMRVNQYKGINIMNGKKVLILE